MHKYILILTTFVITITACNNKNYNDVKSKATLSNDTIVHEFEPNRKVTTSQFLKSDSLNTKIVNIQYFSDSLILNDIYCNDYMSSEYDGTADAEYHYYYNNERKLLFKYSYCWLDTSKYQCQYFNENNNCHILKYNYSGEINNVSHPDSAEDSIWVYASTFIERNDKLGNRLEYFDSPNRIRYTYKYANDKLIEEKSFINDNIPYWTENIEYKNDTIKRTHINHDSFPIPSYTEFEVLDKNGNIISLEKYDDKNRLMRRYKYSFDSENRLIKMQCFNENDELKVTHTLTYELLK